MATEKVQWSKHICNRCLNFGQLSKRPATADSRRFTQKLRRIWRAGPGRLQVSVEITACAPFWQQHNQGQVFQKFDIPKCPRKLYLYKFYISVYITYILNIYYKSRVFRMGSCKGFISWPHLHRLQNGMCQLRLHQLTTSVKNG